MSDITLVNGSAWLDRVDEGDSTTFEAAMSRAVNLDHPCEDYAGCDIARARAEGFTWVAAYLLMGATETPHIGALMDCYPVGTFPVGRAGSDPLGWDDWVEFHNTWGVNCPACNGYTYGDHSWRPDVCSDCHKPLPAPCAHSWVSGMMAVSDEDVHTVAEMRQASGSSLPECERCDAVYDPVAATGVTVP